MSDSIVPIPTSITTLNPDRRPRRDPRTPLPDNEPETAAEIEGRKDVAPVGVSDEAAVEAGTLFSASILGERIRSVAADLSAMHVRQSRRWSPPESQLRLKDKSI